jgi:O-antigen ligase
MAARTELPTRLLSAALLASAFVVGVVAGFSPPVAIGITLGLVFVAIAMANLTVGICLLALTTFLEAFLPADQGTSAVPKLLGLVLVLSWFMLITAGDRERRERIFSPPAFVFVLVSFVGWAAMSAVWAEDPGAAIEATTRYLPNGMLFLIVFAGVRTREELLWVVGSLVVGAALAALYGMVVGAPTDELAAGAVTDEPERVAIGNANETAAALVVGGTLATALAVALRGKPVLRLATTIAVPLCLFAVFLTLSRGGLMALAAALIAAIVMAGRRRRGAALVVAACAVLATVIYFGAFASVEARDRVLEVEGGSGRTDIWTVGWRMVEDNPLRGVGAGNFSISSIHYLLEPGALPRDDLIVDEAKVVHNTYLHVLSELGLVGLTLFLGVIAFSLWCASRAVACASRAGDRQLEVLARALVVALVGLLVADFFGSRQYSKLLWLLMSLCPVLLAISRAELASRLGGGAAAERSPPALPG